jgi:hypothetical protein
LLCVWLIFFKQLDNEPSSNHKELQRFCIFPADFEKLFYFY